MSPCFLFQAAYQYGLVGNGEESMYMVIYRIINEPFFDNDSGCKTALNKLSPGSNEQVLSMLSALLTPAVNQTSQEVRGQNFWASERRHGLSLARILYEV